MTFLTEKEIYKMVFFNKNPELLIKLRETGEYMETIDFYDQLKAGLSIDLSEDVVNMLAKKIPAFKKTIFILHPLKTKPERNELSYAAATEKEISRIVSFGDEDKSYLIKFVPVKEKIKMFLFSALGEELRNFTLRFQPQNQPLHLNDNFDPYEFTELPQFTTIELEFH